MKKTNVLRDILRRDSLVDKLFREVEDYDIYAHLIGYEPEVNECIHSPIRGTDDFPSFALFIPTKPEIVENMRPETIWFKDLADGRFGDVLRFAKYYAFHHYGEDLDTLYKIVGFIDDQMGLGLVSGKEKNWVKTARSVDYEKHRKPIEILYKSRKFTKRDNRYWEGYGIGVETLNKYNVKSIRYLLKDNGEIRKEFRQTELAFIYEIYDKCKLYQPLAPKSFKFRNSCPGSDPHYYQGYEQLEGHDTLIITKSLKDVMCFKEMFNLLGTPVDSLAPHAESILLTEKFIKAVKKAYKRVIAVSDFDLAGVKFARRCRDEGFEVEFIDTNRQYISGKYKVVDKDISDFYLNNGERKTLKLLKKWKIE